MTFLSAFIGIAGVMNGIDAMLIYSTKIFEVGEGRQAEVNGRYGTILMGAIQPLFSLFSFYFVDKWSR